MFFTADRNYSGSFIHTGAPDMQERPIYESVDLSDGRGRVVVFDWSEDNRARLENLVCVDASGDVVWTAELPEGTGQDCFTGVRLVCGAVYAFTWSSFMLTLDPASGKTLGSVFTK